MISSEVRASIAAIALAHAKQEPVVGLMDHSRDKALKISVHFEGQILSGLDMERRAQWSGTLPDLFDHGRSSFIHLSNAGNKYDIYDHASGTYAHVVVTGDSVALFDHGAASWSQYSV